MEAEWQREVDHPAQYQQRHRGTLCPVIDERALPAATPASHIPLHETVNQRYETARQSSEDTLCDSACGQIMPPPRYREAVSIWCRKTNAARFSDHNVSRRHVHR